MVAPTVSRESVPFEVWSTGADGTRFVCAEHLRRAQRRVGRGLSTWPTFSWKTEPWAFRHAAAFDHTLVEIEDLPDLLDSWRGEQQMIS